MPEVFEYTWDTPTYKGKTSFNTGVHIGGKWLDGANKTTIEYVARLTSPDQQDMN